MTRRVKTVRNFAVVLVILAAVFWRAALYLTSDACVLASVEELGYGTCEIIRRDVYEDGYIYVLRTVDDDYTIYRTERFGPFWHTGGGGGSMDFEPRNGAPIYTTMGGNEDRSYAVCKRDDPDIARIEWVCKDGTVIAADDWTQDIILTVISSGLENAQGNVRAYDTAGNWVYEKEVIG